MGFPCARLPRHLECPRQPCIIIFAIRKNCCWPFWIRFWTRWRLPCSGSEQEQAGARGQIHALVELILLLPADQRAVIRLSSQEMAQLSLPARQAFDRAYHRKFLDRIRSILSDGIQGGELRPVDPTVAAWALLGMMYPYFYPAHSSDLLSPLKVADDLVDIFLVGVACPPAS